MNYKYMKTAKMDVQGSIVISSLSQGDTTIDLTGNYDIDDIATLLDGYMLLNLDDSSFGEVGLRNGFTDTEYLDVDEITIKKATSGFDSDKFNNLLKLLGFSDGRTIYTTDQTFSELEPTFGIVVSPYLGGKIPLMFSIPNSKIKGGYTNYTPFSIKNGGTDSVSNVAIYSNNFRVRRGYTFTFKGTEKFLTLVDVAKDVFKSPTVWYMPTDFSFVSDTGLILLAHQDYESSMIYPTIGVKSFSITFLKEV